MATIKKKSKPVNLGILLEGKAYPKPGKDFQLIKAIRGKKQKGNDGEAQLYKANVVRRDTKVRKFVKEHLSTTNDFKEIMPGQLIMFNYFMPKTEEQLKYYDAMPCTIFFGSCNTKEGPRVIGFNLHYYPPKIRYEVIDRIFEIFKPLYLESWDKPIEDEMDIKYKMLMKQLQKAKLDFGVRMYIPELMDQITLIPPKYWQKAVFTEGRFKKLARQAILNYWTQKKERKIK
jgi:hypothetical protein